MTAENIRAEGMERSKAVETFEYLTTNIGPRLTNSPAHRQAIAWAQQTAKVREASFIAEELKGVRDLYAKNLVQLTRLSALERLG